MEVILVASFAKFPHLDKFIDTASAIPLSYSHQKREKQKIHMYHFPPKVPYIPSSCISLAGISLYGQNYFRNIPEFTVFPASGGLCSPDLRRGHVDDRQVSLEQVYPHDWVLSSKVEVEVVCANSGSVLNQTVTSLLFPFLLLADWNDDLNSGTEADFFFFFAYMVT